MNGVLVDTSVWIAHFRAHQPALAQLPSLNLVLSHPLVIGELACGTPPRRRQTLQDLRSLRQTRQASIEEAITFVECHGLHGKGCGLVDMLLLASTLLTDGARLWTLDRRLASLARDRGVLFDA